MAMHVPESPILVRELERPEADRGFEALGEELEATGEAESYYGPKQLADRRRQARLAGLRAEDAGRVEVDFDLAATLRAYDESPVWDAAGSVAFAA